MFEIFAVIQIVICILLVIIILLQEGKKGMGAIFGGSSASVFGARGAGNVLTKITSILAILFMINSVWMSYISSSDKSVVDSVAVEQKTPAEQPEKAREVPTRQTAPAEQPEKAREVPAQQTAPAEQPEKAREVPAQQTAPAE